MKERRGELLPCPQCNREGDFVVWSHRKIGAFCPSCGYTAEDSHSIDIAIEQWNDRARKRVSADEWQTILESRGFK